MYNKIYDFCKVRNKGTCYENGPNPSPRAQFLIDLIDSLGIKQELDEFGEEPTPRYPKYGEKFKNLFMFDDFEIEEPAINKMHNIIMPGTSNRMVIAHHDVNNARLENANDNSASCINAIALKLLVPSLNVVLTDGEEFTGHGSTRLANKIRSGEFGSIEWVLNLELTGSGGELFFIGDYPGKLSDHILSLFDCPIVRTPFNDSVNLRKFGIDSTVINPLPVKKHNKKSRYFEPVFMNGQELDTDILMLCHHPQDTVSKISTADMKAFVEKVLYPIVTK
jgi:hypothetical protein